MPVTVVFMHSHSNKWLDISRHLVARAEKSGEKVVLCDVSSLSTPSAAIYSRFFLRRRARDFIRSVLMKNHALKILSPWGRMRNWKELGNEDFFEKISHLRLPLRSHMATFMRSQEPTESWLGKLVWAVSLIKLGLARHQLLSFFEEIKPDKVYVPSGRSPSTRLIGMIGKSAGSEVLWTEWDSIGAGLFVGLYRIHDRRSTLEAIAEWKSRCDHNHDKAKEWIANRLTPESHEFSIGFEQGSNYNFANVFCPSSPDEFLFLGQDWEEPNWSSQYEAFGCVLRKLDNEGLESAIRLHPIMLKKDFRQVRREVAELRSLWASHPNLTIFHPKSSANTYKLVSSAKRAFVARSHLMFESAFLGTPVWNTFNHICDTELDSRPLYSADGVEAADFSPVSASNQVDTDKNLCALSFFLSRVEELGEWKSQSDFLREKRSYLLTMDSALLMLLVRGFQLAWINLTYVRVSLAIQGYRNRRNRKSKVLN